jgi:purine-binding chemotaxis protein CheW
MSSVFVRFRIGAERYALPVENVLEVAEIGQLAPVPGAPEPVLGVRNLHGQVLAVVDLAAALGREHERAPSRLLIVEAEGVRAGLAIDAVDDVGELHDPDAEPLDLDAVLA